VGWLRNTAIRLVPAKLIVSIFTQAATDANRHL
jgi:hypothetical protein